MKRIAIFIALLVACATPAWADFDSGLSAYMKADYRTAYAEFAPLADQGNADAQNMLVGGGRPPGDRVVREH
jgi:hypothetical protein